MKNWKQAAAAGLAACMLLTTVPYSVMAKATTGTTTAMSKEQAIEAAKKLVSIPDGYELVEASYYESKDHPGIYGQNSVWTIRFEKKGKPDNGSITFTMHGKTGALLNLNAHDNDDGQGDSAISRDEARTMVKEYLNKLAPDRANQVTEEELPQDFGSGQTMHTFKFVRTVDGIPYPPNHVSITVNGKGQLRNYYCEWTEGLEFPKPVDAISKERATEAFKAALTLELRYQRVYKPDSKDGNEAKLFYGPYREGHNFPVIDAMKGVEIDSFGEPVQPKTAAGYSLLAEKPGEPKVLKDLTQEEAAEMVAAYQLNLSGYKQTSGRYEKHSERNSVWTFEYQKGEPNDPKTHDGATVSIDAKTGELRFFIRHEFGEEPYKFPTNPRLSEEQARQKAIGFVKQAIPTKVHLIALDPLWDVKHGLKTGPAYAFHFVRLVNGIPFRDGTIALSMDPDTGNIKEFFSGGDWNADIQFAPAEGIVTMDQARGKFAEAFPLRLQYLPVFEKGKNPYEQGPQKGVALVYAPPADKYPHDLDAVKGEWEVPEPPKRPVANDIKGHWAEKYLQWMLDRGVMIDKDLKDGKMYPDEGVTRGDMMRYLIKSGFPTNHQWSGRFEFSDVPDSDFNFGFIQSAVNSGWVDPEAKRFRPNDFLIREELADVMVTIMGYGKLSTVPNTFINRYRDITSDRYVGDIAIVSSLGIMTGYGGNFDPRGVVTKAQAAVVINRVWDHLAEKQSSGVYMQ
ncbi:YcdB/YcdC domain-containing protein [Effusibacillus lacus]|uniref:SLH domain-containing protein n=1 Tax=Effusibacillus lacus TaxID=1348429 RepID=A0A292YM52_9BACL|nr:YcdB/YcdC domain-containing protein [Effusibacillus lacus]TCS70496.1 S-layer family protein [Effusibacillus lacus]GAX89550.1 hypothetical protein EFBL_1174 [Effusibacillus lacus]